MARKTDERRATLRDSLTDIAERVICAEGLSAVKARDLATQAGCSVGMIYNVFGDLTDLVLAVNARTFRRLGAAVAGSPGAGQTEPVDQLIDMARAYHAFAADNRPAWRALFDLERPAGQTAPDWYLAEMAQLFAFIDAPLQVIYPKMDDARRALMTRALFSSIHGIVLLGLDDASAGVPRGQIDRMIALILRQVAGKST